MTLLSLCMIVKNEEKVIERCLDSVSAIVDEIILIDTGSTDKTIEIARSYTNLIFPFEWSNNFSAARNEGIKKATGKWILILDADEYLQKDEAVKMRAFLESQQPQAHLVYNLPIINYTGSIKSQNILESSADRIFPNYMDIQYDRPIHEQLISLRPGIQIRYAQVPYRIFHTGYLQEAIDEKDKHKRNMQIFEAMKHQKQNFDEYDYFTLGNEYQAKMDFATAAEHYEKALTNASKKKAWYPHALIGLINAKFKLDDLTYSWGLLESKLSSFKQYPEYHTIKGLHLESLGWFKEAKACYKEAVAQAEKSSKTSNQFWIISPDYGSRIPFERLTDLSFRQNQPGEGISWLTMLLMNDRYQLPLLIRLVEWLIQNEEISSVQRLLDGMYDLNTPSDLALLTQATLSVGQLQLYEHYSKLLGVNTASRTADNLRLALMRQHESDWRKGIEQINYTMLDPSIIRHIQLGALIWKDTAVLKNLLENTTDSTKDATNLLLQLLSNELSTSEELLDSLSGDLFSLAKDLYLLKQLETFDTFVVGIQHPKLINALANYFYSRNQIETAINYYSILFNSNHLDVSSCENLGIYYLSQNMEEDAAEFLNMALELDRTRKYLYYPLITCSKGNSRQAVIDLFRETFPQYTRLPFVKML